MDKELFDVICLGGCGAIYYPHTTNSRGGRRWTGLGLKIRCYPFGYGTDTGYSFRINPSIFNDRANPLLQVLQANC